MSNYIFVNGIASVIFYLWVMLRYILLILLVVVLFRFVTRFLLPVLRITANVRGQMRNMQQGARPEPAPAPVSRKEKRGDYIDYEEIR